MNPTKKGRKSNHIKTSPHGGGFSLQRTLDAFSLPRKLAHSTRVQSARRFCTLVKKDIYPVLKFKRRHNTVYDNNVFLDLLTHTAITHNFTESGSETFKLHTPNAPHVNTVLYHIKKIRYNRCYGKIWEGV